MKKLVCLLLAALLLMSAAACGTTKESSAAPAAEEAGGTDTQEQASLEDLPAITWGFTNQTFEPESTKWPTDVFLDFQQAVADKVGVRLEFTGWQDNQAFELALAGGDLPDMFTLQSDYVTPLLSGDHVLKLDDYLEHAPNLQAASPLRIAAMREYYSKDDEGLYFWTPYVGNENPGSAWWNGMAIRWDYYKELGYPEVKTEDDFLDVVKQAVELHPETEDGKKVFGVANASDGTLWHWWIRGCLYGYHNITDSYSLDYRDGNNQIVNNYTDLDSPVWRDIRYYFKANQMGLYDPDSLTMKGDDLNAKATNGQLVATDCTWYGGQLAQNERAKDPESLAQYMILPVEGQYNWGNQRGNIGWSFYHGVNKSISDPVAAVKIIDYMNTPEGVRMGYMGKEGGNWEIVDSVPTVTQRAIDDRMQGGDHSTIKTGGIWNGSLGLAGSVELDDGGPADLWNVPDVWELTLTPADKDYSAHYGVQVPAQAAQKLIEDGKAFDKREMNADLLTLLPSPPQDISRIDARCLDIMIKAIPRLVMADSQEEFDTLQEEALSEFEDANVQTSIDWWKAQEAEINTFLDSVE